MVIIESVQPLEIQLKFSTYLNLKFYSISQLSSLLSKSLKNSVITKRHETQKMFIQFLRTKAISNFLSITVLMSHSKDYFECNNFHRFNKNKSSDF